MEVETHFKAGGSFVKLRPQFSANAENVYVAWKNQILGYNTKTGARFAEFKGIKDVIVGFSIHYYNQHECITACSASGQIITWKIVTFFKIINKKIGKSRIRSFHVVSSGVEELKALISYKEGDANSFCVYDLVKDASLTCNLKIHSNHYQVDVCSDNFFAVINKCALHIVSFEDTSNVYTSLIEKNTDFTCLACHPSEAVIITGDSAGRVFLWQKIFSVKPAKATFHWHTLPVKCLSFSTLGSYFFSGGEESVLVRWQADNQLEKKFLPRLPSTIAQISVSSSNALIAIATDDNAVRIVNSTLDNISLIQNLVIGDNFDSGIVYDPLTKALVMNGNVGHIQFYSPSDNSLLYNVDVVGQNKVSDERNAKIENTQVCKVAVSKNGLWMATVETRNDPDYSSELRLKFWKFDVNTQNFTLNTSVEKPHENCVNAISFQPVENKLKLVTVGGDKFFKIWCLTKFETVNDTRDIWKCLCNGFYHNLTCRSVSFSVDGSLLAVSFDKIITTWLPDSCYLKCSLVHPVCSGEIKHMAFGSSNQCHLLVAASDDRLSVWNLLTLTMIWTVQIEVSILISDVITSNMAVITNNMKLFVFAPISAEPIYSCGRLLQKQQGICAAVFVPGKYSNDVRMRWYQRSSIFFINSRRELYCLGSEEESLDSPSDVYDISNSLFSMEISQKEVNHVQSKDPVHHLYTKDVGQRNFKKYLEAPIQTMIPIRMMAASLLRSMVLQRS